MCCARRWSGRGRDRSALRRRSTGVFAAKFGRERVGLFSVPQKLVTQGLVDAGVLGPRLEPRGRKPDDAVARYNLGYALWYIDRLEEVISEYYEALRLWEDYADVRFFGAAFTAAPGLAEGLQAPHRDNAACAAVLAGCGQGKDADKLDDRERGRLRRQASAGCGLTWRRSACS
jgi:hypothetical protein